MNFHPKICRFTRFVVNCSESNLRTFGGAGVSQFWQCQDFESAYYPNRSLILLKLNCCFRKFPKLNNRTPQPSTPCTEILGWMGLLFNCPPTDILRRNGAFWLWCCFLPDFLMVMLMLISGTLKVHFITVQTEYLVQLPLLVSATDSLLSKLPQP